MHSLIKICGLSEEVTLRAAIDAGADFIGLVHYPKSPRHVSLARAAELKRLIPAPVQSVMVLVDAEDDLLCDVIATVAPDYIQLHGHETPARVADIRRQFPAQKFIKAIAVRSGDDVASAHAFEPFVDMLLFDAKPPLLSSPPPHPLYSSPPPLAGEAGRGNLAERENGYFGVTEHTSRNRKLFSFAKVMRNKMTEAEWVLWKLLSAKKLGYKFRRQHTIGNYIVDFVCIEKKLIIEIDGSQHVEVMRAYDEKRTLFLHDAGYRVMRFWNNDVISNTEGVAMAILEVLKSDSLPLPLPQAGGVQSKVQYLPGGNGLSFDWALLKGRQFTVPWLLSGGLTADNVADAITQTQPYGVDVSSGVERAAGVKDAELIRAFIHTILQSIY